MARKRKALQLADWDLLSAEQTEQYCIPVWDCPHCNSKNIPLSGEHLTMTPPPELREKLGEVVDMEIWSCSHCDIIPEEESQIKGYVSQEQLLAAGWVQADANQA